jgi:hypothetical protein
MEALEASCFIQASLIVEAPAAALPFFVAPPFAADLQFVVDYQSLAVTASGSKPLPASISLHPEAVDITPDLGVAVGIASTMEYQDGEELAHNFAEPKVVQTLWPFGITYHSVSLEDL